VAWLGGHDAKQLAAMFYPVVYGRDPSPAQLQDIADTARPLSP
jgi:hypothetical protein